MFSARETFSMLPAVVVAFALIATTGCESSRPPSQGGQGQSPADYHDPDMEPVIIAKEPDFILTVVMDTSGSFTSYFDERDGRAYRFLLALVDVFFRKRIGSDDRIILTQLSANSRGLLWEGSPRDLRQKFPNAGAFRQYVLSRSNPFGSLVHKALADSADYLTAKPGIKSGQTKSVLVALTDMEDNDPDTKSEERLMKSLAAYSRTGGGVCIYWASLSKVGVWRDNLQKAGVKRFVVESEIFDNPKPLDFED